MSKIYSLGLVKTSHEESAKVKEILIKHNETTFHEPENPFLRTDTIEHKILITGRPVRIPPCRIPPGLRKIIEDEMLEMEKECNIQMSSGPWCSPIILVRKKDGTIRFCVDYSKLNDATH